MQIYQGVDIVEIAKLRRIVHGSAGFAPSVFTAAELEYCASHRERFQHLAGRFAAKEACLKALGLGLSVTGAAAGLLDIEVVNLASGRPELRLHGWIAKLCARKGVHQRTVSLSHTREYAVATVVLLGAAAARTSPPTEIERQR